jgi:polar amino acid transport system permease protein
VSEATVQVIFDNAHLIWEGLRVTLELSAVVIGLSAVFGLLIGIGLLYGPLLVRILLRAYVDIIRGIPLLVIIFLIFYGLPALDIDIFGVHIPTNLGRFTTATIAFTLFSSAHVSEIVRGAIGSVPQGQTDAAKAIGLTFWPRLLSILLPQSLPVIIPPWVNTASEIVKGSSLVVLVSMSDLLFSTRKIAERTGEVLPLYGAAAMIYFVICFSISRFGIWLGGRYRYGIAR